MTRAFCLALASAGCLAAAAPALAQDSEAAQAAYEARHSHMELFSYNLGPLGAMAQGDVEYDAETAAVHAENIANLARVEFAPYWVEGSSSEEIEDSRALPAIWDNLDDVAAQREDLVAAADDLAAAAPEGVDAFREAFRAVGQSCGGCHEDYREPEDE